MKLDAKLDDVAWNKQLADAEARARDMTPAMREIAERMEQRVRNTFRTETDPWGDPWAPWKWPEAMQKQRMKRGSGSQQILLDEGHLFGSIERTWDATSATITAGEDGPSADYAMAHQFGNDVLAQRAFMPMRTPEDNTLPAEWYDEASLPLLTHMLDAFE